VNLYLTWKSNLTVVTSATSGNSKQDVALVEMLCAASGLVFSSRSPLSKNNNVDFTKTELSLVENYSVEDRVLAVGRSKGSSLFLSSSLGGMARSSIPPALSGSAIRELALRGEEFCKSPKVLKRLFLDPMDLDILDS
jgi:hypothetical protein